MLSDFGIAKILEQEETTALTGTGVGIGTPEYMSPEQGMGHGVDHRTDIYSLGVVLYELITGRKPFQADTPMAVVLKHITEPLPRPKSVVPDLPDRVEKVIFKALAKQPDERYQSMSAFASALEEIAYEKLPQATLTDEKLTADNVLHKDTAAVLPQRIMDRQPSPMPVFQPVSPVVSHPPPPLPARQAGVVSARPPAVRKGAFPALGGMALIAVLLVAGVLALAGLVYVLYGTQTVSQSQDRLATLVAQTETVFSLMRETDLAGTFTALTSTAQMQASLPATASPSPVITVSNTPPPCSNQAAFVADVTIPDGAELPPYKDFVKTWRLRNDGTCTWTSGYQIVFDSGYQMGGPVSKMLTSADVQPGGTLDISVNLTAPSDAGTYRGNWCLQSANGERFGIGADAAHCLYVQIKVVNPLATTSSSGDTSGGKPDLLITDITWSPDPPIKHTNTHVKVAVYNQGNAPATNFTVRWWGLETFANPSCEWNVASLVAHGGYVLECDFTFASHYAPMNTTAHVDDENNVLESDESNNKFKKVIDVN
ncbi:MAG: protein kinase [Anaerolineae bacterium]|nr:protein kinase [Anaerolineae bacterium]